MKNSNKKSKFSAPICFTLTIVTFTFKTNNYSLTARHFVNDNTCINFTVYFQAFRNSEIRWQSENWTENRENVEKVCSFRESKIRVAEKVWMLHVIHNNKHER